MNINLFSRRRPLLRCRVPDQQPLDEWTEPKHRRADAVAMATSGGRLDRLDQLVGTPRLRWVRWCVEVGIISDQTTATEPCGRDGEAV